MILAKCRAVEYIWEKEWGEDDPGRLERNIYCYKLTYVEESPPFWQAKQISYSTYESLSVPNVGWVTFAHGSDRVEIYQPLDPKLWK